MLQILLPGMILSISFLEQCSCAPPLFALLAAIVLIRNKRNEAPPIIWYAKKIKRLCSSSLEAELIALVKGMGQVVYLKQVLEELHRLPENTIPVSAITDHRGLYEAIHSTTTMDMRRLRGKLTKVKDHLVRREIDIFFLGKKRRDTSRRRILMRYCGYYRRGKGAT